MIYNYKERGSPKLSLIAFFLLFLIIDTANSLPEETEPDLLTLQGDTSATILLTPGGTRNYLRKNNNRKTYVNDLSNEILKALAFEKERIFIPYDRYQYKEKTREDQILLRVNIKGTKTPDQTSSFVLRSSLDKAIISKGNSSIPIGPRTMDIDSTYGAPETPRLWHRNKFILIGVVIGLFLLLLLSFLAKKRFRKGRNFLTIVLFPLILVDFVLDIMVLAVHGRDLKWFFICGLMFLTVPIFFNIIISWFLMDYQLATSKATLHWRMENPRTALGFILLSCIDLEALNVVSSRCAGYSKFNAKFSDGGRLRVLISIIIITFIEDVPQLIIYTLYQRYTVITAIIPILVLSSSCIILLFKVVSFIYLIFTNNNNIIILNHSDGCDASSVVSGVTIEDEIDYGYRGNRDTDSSSGSSGGTVETSSKKITDIRINDDEIMATKVAGVQITEEAITEEQPIKEQEETTTKSKETITTEDGDTTTIIKI